MVGIVNPLPCFGCFWDCTFDRGICVESISVEAATGALKGILAQSTLRPPQIVESNAVPVGEQRIIAEATSVYRRAQEDRRTALERAAVIGELQRALDDRDRHAKHLQDAAEQHEKHISQLGAALAEREGRIAALTPQLRDLPQLRAALEETDRRAKSIQEAADARAAKLQETEAALEALENVHKDAELLRLQVGFLLLGRGSVAGGGGWW